MWTRGDSSQFGIIIDYLPIREAVVHVGLEITNLLDQTYREYTSLLRYYADEPGLNVGLRAKVTF